MKKDCFFYLPFLKIDSNELPQKNYCRIIAGDKIFYMFTSQFIDDSVLKKLKRGEKVYIGALPLADGSYWLHWLVSPAHGNLEPKMKGLGNIQNLIKITIALLMVIFSYMLFFHVNIFIGILMVLILLGGLWMLPLAVQKLIVTNSRSMKYLLNGLMRVKSGETTMMHNMPMNVKNNSDQPANNHFNEDDLMQLDLLYRHGNVSNVHTLERFCAKKSYIYYYFSCKKLSFSLSYRNNIFADSIHPLFFRHHPFFIAENDAVKLIIEHQDKETISGIYNECDNSAYVNPGRCVFTPKMRKTTYKVFAGAFMFIVLICLCVEISDLIKLNEIPSKEYLIREAKIMGEAILIIIAPWAGMLALIEIVGLLIRRFSADQARFLFTRKILALHRQKNGKNSFVHEIH